MKITENQKRWLLKKVDGVWCKSVSRPGGGYDDTILPLKQTSEVEFSQLGDADSYTSLDVADLLDLIHDILPDDFVSDVRAAKKIVGEDGIPVGVFAKNGDATNVGCKGVFGHDLDWSEIYLENVKEHATPLARASCGCGVRVRITLDHVNRAASGGCVSRLVVLWDS